MLICYPNYYILSAMPIISLNEDEYIAYNDEGNEVYNTYRNISDNIFEEIDEEYVNKTLNNNI